MSAKLFLGGLPQDSNTQAVQEYFAQFGQVIDAVCMEGRGFGFVTYASPEEAMAVLQMEHVLGGRTLDVKEATVAGTKGAPQKGGKGGGGGGGGSPFMAWGGSPAPFGGGGGGAFMGTSAYAGPPSKTGAGKGGAGMKTNKIFVGGLPPDCADEKLQEHFMAYGALVDCVVMKDKTTGRPRGFGFVQFDNTDSADAVMADYANHQIDGKWIETKRATPQDAMSKGGGGKASAGAMMGMMGAMMGAKGGYGGPMMGGCYGGPPQPAFAFGQGGYSQQYAAMGGGYGGGKGKKGYSPY